MIFETHLGWACAGLGKQITALMEDWQYAGGQRKALVDRLVEIYGLDQELPDSDEDLLELAKNLGKGVPIATPCSTGARIGDIEEHLRMAGLDPSGQSILFDGQTGEQFQAPGHGRLHLHAEAAPPGGRQDPRPLDRPYSLVTQQPLAARPSSAVSASGKWRCGLWKPTAPPTPCRRCSRSNPTTSPDGPRSYESIVRGDDTFEAGIPESFNVLVQGNAFLGPERGAGNSLIAASADMNRAREEPSAPPCRPRHSDELEIQ